MTLDPLTLDAAHLEDSCYAMQAALLLEDILRCGVIVVDKQKRLMNALRRVAEGYRDRSVPKKIMTLLEELFKLELRKFVEVDVAVNAAKPLDTAIHIACTEVLDLLVGQPVAKEIPFLRQAQVSEYFSSELRGEFQSMDKLRQVDTVEQLERIVASVSRYSATLRFYDKFIGRCEPQRIRFFRDGLVFFIQKWLQYSKRMAESGRVEIFSIAYDCAGASSLKAQKQINELAASLQHQTGVQVTGYLKKGDSSAFHARYLQTDQAVLLIERGFDVFRRGKLIPFPIAHAEGMRSHLRDFRALDDVLS